MKTSKKPDYILIISVFALVIFGLIALSSASAVLSYEKFGSNYYYFTHQLIYGVIFGVIALLITSKIDYHYWKKLAVLMLFLTLVLF